MPDSFQAGADAASMSVTVDADFSGFRSELAEATRTSRQFGAALANSFEGLVLRGRGLTEVVRGLAQSLSQIAMRAAFKPLETMLGTGLAGLFSGGLPGGAGMGFAHGGVFQGGVPVPFAHGGVIASPISFPLGGGRHGIAGERGAEAIMPLARGPDGRLGVVASGGGGAVQVHVNIATPDIEGFQRAESQITAALARAVARGRRNL